MLRGYPVLGEAEVPVTRDQGADPVPVARDERAGHVPAAWVCLTNFLGRQCKTSNMLADSFWKRVWVTFTTHVDQCTCGPILPASTTFVTLFGRSTSIDTPSNKA
jgi:hypothetical protein